MLRNLHYDELQMYLRKSQINAVDIANQGTVQMALGGDGASGSKASSRRRACKSEWPLQSLM